MKKILILFIIFFNLENSYADNKIAYIDIDYILNNSIVGKSITEHIQKIKLPSNIKNHFSYRDLNKILLFMDITGPFGNLSIH